MKSCDKEVTFSVYMYMYSTHSYILNYDFVEKTVSLHVMNYFTRLTCINMVSTDRLSPINQSSFYVSVIVTNKQGLTVT